MRSTFSRNGAVTIAGSVVALCLVLQTSVVLASEQDPKNNSGEIEPNLTASQTLVDGSKDGEYLPVVKVHAEYPARAIERGIEGSVTVEFTVTEKGIVEDPVVVESDPPGIFDRAALNAALKFKYKPKVVDGQPIRVDGVKHKIVFELEDEASVESGSVIEDSGQYLPIVKVRPKYPQRALSRGIEGSVTMKFTVTESGTVEDPVVFESDPPGIFDRVATDAVLLYKYRPKVVDGEPVRVEGVKNKIVFAIEN